MTSWRTAVAEAAGRLANAREARWLAEEVSGRAAGELALALDDVVGRDELARFTDLVERRRRGEPLQHVLGHWPFRNIELTVDRRALVPRPETEIVVGEALAALARWQSASARREALVVDLGTGSGAIACALAHEAPDLRVIAVDIDADALALAELNRQALEPQTAARIELIRGSWFDAVPASLHGMIDCIVTNPPYLARAEWDELEPVVKDHDPYGALVAGPTGLEAYEVILAGSGNMLSEGGAVIAEIAPHQAGDLVQMAWAAGAAVVEIRRDLAGRERVLTARWPDSR